MKKNILVLILALAMVLTMAACGCKHETWNEANCTTPRTCAECGETEGEALGHVWTAATCEAPKTCETCGLTEGEPKAHDWQEATCIVPKMCSFCKLTEGDALGHDWQEATTEAPKTCAACGNTEGSRIVTDERFTTEANKHLFGKWVARLVAPADELGAVIGMELEGDLAMLYYVDFRNDGSMVVSVEVEDPDAFMQMMIDYTVEVTYQSLEQEGYTRSQADLEFKQVYGMTIPEYVEAEMAALDISFIFDMMKLNYVYYAKGEVLYLGMGWNSELQADKYRLEEGNLYLPMITGDDTPFTPYTEPVE